MSFGGVKLTKNAGQDKNCYSGYAAEVGSFSLPLFPNFGVGKNIFILQYAIVGHCIFKIRNRIS